MMLFGIGIELPYFMSVQRFQNSHPRQKHPGNAALSGGAFLSCDVITVASRASAYSRRHSMSNHASMLTDNDLEAVSGGKDTTVRFNLFGIRISVSRFDGPNGADHLHDRSQREQP